MLSLKSGHMNIKLDFAHLNILSAGVAAVWGLIRNFHLIQVLPREGEYSLGMIIQMCDVAL